MKKILIIDDDPGVHLIVNPLLIKQGHMVISANNGEHGLQLALSERPNLIILDVIMPGIKGRDLCVKLKAYEVLKSIPIIFLTAKDSDDDIKAELDAGAVSHVTKPINPEHFLGVINTYIS